MLPLFSMPGSLLRLSAPGRIALVTALALAIFASHARNAAAQGHSYFIDCSAAADGDGTETGPWNSLGAAEAHTFAAGDRVALARGTVCQGSFAPKGSGSAGHVIRLTAYGHGARPRIVAPARARQVLLLFNQEYWQIDSLDLSGANTYGVFVSGDKGTLHHLYLKNLNVHDVYGDTFKNKDNGLVVVGPSSIDVFFDDVSIDGVDAEHTNQWAGILVGGGSFAYRDDAPLNSNVHIRNSTVHDVFGDGIVLFRDRQSRIESSAAWLIGMQTTRDVGTPNAIWTWTCTDCTVADNEAYLTDSPGVDGGAYDIDWNNHNNVVSGNYAHDTEGYCVAVFGAGYVTSNSRVIHNLCINNGLSPRLAALQGAVYLSTWNGGVLRDVALEDNTIVWNPRNAGSGAIVSNASVNGAPIVFAHNTVESTSPLIYRTVTAFMATDNLYKLDGAPLFSIGDKRELTLEQWQAAGMEMQSKAKPRETIARASSAKADATMKLELDEDGLLTDETRSKLLVLRNAGGQYSSRRLQITVHLPRGTPDAAEANALRDLEDVYPGALHFVRDVDPGSRVLGEGSLHITRGTKKQGFDTQGAFTAATVGRVLYSYLGAPDYSHMQPLEQRKEHP